MRTSHGITDDTIIQGLLLPIRGVRWDVERSVHLEKPGTKSFSARVTERLVEFGVGKREDGFLGGFRASLGESDIVATLDTFRPLRNLFGAQLTSKIAIEDRDNMLRTKLNQHFGIPRQLCQLGNHWFDGKLVCHYGRQ